MDKIAGAAIAIAVVLFGGIWYMAGRAGSEPAPADLYSAGRQAAPAPSPQAAATTTPQNPTTSTNKKAMQAILHTNKGDITIEFSGATPNTVANFTKLASAGFYDGTKFHRVIAGFMIQGGDPLTKDDSKQAQWGTGGPGYQFADEIGAGNHNGVGTIAMANAGPNTNGSQFFINVADNAFLDAKHTVFGHVVAGMDAVTAIEHTPTAPGDRPVEPVVVTSVELK
jgi:peptidylprolyl isomerase